MRHRAALHAAGALSLALAASGCVPTAGAKANETMETMRVEHAPDRLVARGRAFASVGDHTRAEQYLAAALEEGADPDLVLPILLRVCLAEKRYRVAIDYAEPVLKKKPSDERLRFVVASLYASIGDVAAAREHLETIARDKPDHADVHFALAVLLRDEEGDIVGADKHFREYVRIKPGGPHAEEARASLLRSVP